MTPEDPIAMERDYLFAAAGISAGEILSFHRYGPGAGAGV